MNYVSVVSRSRKCFLQHLRYLHVLASGHEERDYEVLRTDMDPKRFVLSVDDDTEFRSRCE